MKIELSLEEAKLVEDILTSQVVNDEFDDGNPFAIGMRIEAQLKAEADTDTLSIGGVK